MVTRQHINLAYLWRAAIDLSLECRELLNLKTKAKRAARITPAQKLDAQRESRYTLRNGISNASAARRRVQDTYVYFRFQTDLAVSIFYES